MTASTNFDHFETDQLRYALMLWRLVRKAGDADFDVPAFGQDWQYAETVILQCLASRHEVVAIAALDLLQLRLRFERLEPVRASALGARVPCARPTQADGPAVNGTTIQADNRSLEKSALSGGCLF